MPKIDRSRVAHNCKVKPIVKEDKVIHRLRHACVHYARAIAQIPEVDTSVRSPGSQYLTIWGKRNLLDVIVIYREGLYDRLITNPAQSQLAIKTTRSKQLPIWMVPSELAVAIV